MDIKTKSAGNEQPLVSVFIPSYNGADFIAQTIQSVLDQTYQNFELVICDDCSPDNTVEVIRSFQDSRIRLIQNEKNLGYWGNFSKCIETTKGAYLKLLNDDDMLAPAALEKAVSILQAYPEVSLVAGSSLVIGSDNEVILKRSVYRKDRVLDGKSFARRTFHFGRNLYSETGMMTFRNDKEFLRKFFSEAENFGIDWELGLELSCVGKVYYLADVVGYFRISTDSLSVKTKPEYHFSEHMKIFTRHQKKGILHLTEFDRLRFKFMVSANNTARYLIQRMTLFKRNRGWKT